MASGCDSVVVANMDISNTMGAPRFVSASLASTAAAVKRVTAGILPQSSTADNDTSYIATHISTMNC